MSLEIRIRLLSYWRAGSGRGQAGSLDALCLRDEVGLPILPGKHLRGLLREAVEKAHELKWHEIRPDLLFGSRMWPGAADSSPQQQETSAGILRVDSARLSRLDRDAIRRHERDLAPYLFSVKRSTAMEPVRGVAKPKSLRAEEVALPVELVAKVTEIEATQEDWRGALCAALPLIRVVGAGRTRGLGRCIVTGRVCPGNLRGADA